MTACQHIDIPHAQEDVLDPISAISDVCKVKWELSQKMLVVESA